MPFVPVENTVEYTVETRCFENVAVNVFHSRPNTPNFTDIPIVDRIASVRAAWANRIMPQLVDVAALFFVSGRELSSLEAPSSKDAGPIVSGTKLGEPSVPQCTALIQKVTSLTGKSRRGRMYLSFLPEADVVGSTGSLTEPANVSLQTAFDQFLSDIQAIGGGQNEQMVVVSRYKGVDAAGKPIPRTTGLVTPITRLVVARSIATQRDRNKR